MCCVFEDFIVSILFIHIPDWSSVSRINSSIFPDIEIVKALAYYEIAEVVASDGSLREFLNLVFNMREVDRSTPGKIFCSEVYRCQVYLNSMIAHFSNVIVYTGETAGRRQWTVEQ